MTEKVRVVVADDHPLFRDGVVRALASSDAVEVVAEAADGATALALIKTHVPHVAVLDWRMPGMDAAQVAAAVRRDNLPTRVLVISAYYSCDRLPRAAGGRPDSCRRKPRKAK